MTFYKYNNEYYFYFDGIFFSLVNIYNVNIEVFYKVVSHVTMFFVNWNFF